MLDIEDLLGHYAAELRATGQDEEAERILALAAGAAESFLMVVPAQGPGGPEHLDRVGARLRPDPAPAPILRISPSRSSSIRSTSSRILVRASRRVCSAASARLSWAVRSAARASAR